jgi:hypothetical protein
VLRRALKGSTPAGVMLRLLMLLLAVLTTLGAVEFVLRVSRFALSAGTLRDLHTGRAARARDCGRRRAADELADSMLREAG